MKNETEKLQMKKWNLSTENKNCQYCQSIYCDGTFETYKKIKGSKWSANEESRQLETFL